MIMKIFSDTNALVISLLIINPCAFIGWLKYLSDGTKLVTTVLVPMRACFQACLFMCFFALFMPQFWSISAALFVAMFMAETVYARDCRIPGLLTCIVLWMFPMMFTGSDAVFNVLNVSLLAGFLTAQYAIGRIYAKKFTNHGSLSEVIV